MLTVAFGESTMSREDVNDYARPSCPSTSTTDEKIEAVK